MGKDITGAMETLYLVQWELMEEAGKAPEGSAERLNLRIQHGMLDKAAKILWSRHTGKPLPRGVV